MGLTATWVFAPTDLPATGWEVCENVRPGWSGFLTDDPMRLETTPDEWAGFTGPLLMATVMDSGFVVLTGFVDREPAWRWVLNERFLLREVPDMAEEYGLPGHLADAVPAMIGWTVTAGLPAPGAERLTEVLTWGQQDMLPIDGVAYELFEVLGITQHSVVTT